ncbi:MAG: hypothetical protein ABIQ32_13065 [Sphingomicrobium sp.]
MGPRSANRLKSMRAAALVLSLLLLVGLAWIAFAPLPAGPREQLFEIPRGTHARRMSGDHADILPQTIRLTLGVKDVLVFRNSDVAPHIFGPTLIMPGQSFSLPFSQASTYSFQCTAHANGQLNIVVDPAPTPGWQRLRWRLAAFAPANAA